MIKKFCYTFIFLILASAVYAGKIDKGLKAITEKNYVKAKDYFDEILKATPDHPGANFGMAKYYFATDNPQYNLEKAFEFASKAEAQTKMMRTEIRKEIKDAGINDSDFVKLKNVISDEAFSKAKKLNTIEALNHFIDVYKECGMIGAASIKRNELAFELAGTQNTSDAYKDFMSKYPNSKEYDAAAKKFDEKIYEEKTKPGTEESYKSFLAEYPKSSFTAAAKQKYEQLVYERYLKEGTIESLEKFISTYPESSFLKEAKEKYDKILYETKTQSHTLESYMLFITQYPKSAYFTVAEEQIFVLSTTGEKTPKLYMDFINSNPTNSFTKNAWSMIYNMEINYSDTASFSKFVSKYKNYPDIKNVEKLIQQYRKSMYCIKGKNGHWGFMDENGKLFIPCVYDKAANFNDGMALVQMDGKYGFINKGNIMVIKPVYDFAQDFKGSYARVRGNGKWGMINRTGDTVVAITFEDISDFNKEGLVKVKKGNKYGFVDARNRIVIEPKYDDAKDFYEGYCLVKKDETWLYIDKNGAQIYCIE